MDFSLTGNFVRKIARKAALASFVGFFLLGVLVYFFPILKPDVAISKELQEDWLNGLPVSKQVIQPFMAMVSFFGAPWVASASILSASVVFFLLSYQREAMFVLGTFAADSVNMLIKFIINRPRPGPSFVEVLQEMTDPSFPSGHVVHYVVFFGFLYVVVLSLWKPRKRTGFVVSFVFFGLVIFISLSRVYLGAHWATDVLGGYLLGFAMLWSMLHFYFRGRETVVDTQAEVALDGESSTNTP